MIDLYTFSTPNGRKIPILLEELSVPYRTHIVNIGKNEQFSPPFLAISPNNKIPAIVDDEAGGLSVFESGAILNYLADKHGRFLAPSGAARWKALEWLYWQIGGIGPMFGQLGFFAKRAPEKVPLAINRFTEESERLLGVMNRRLETAPFLAGDEYSIADIACYPWTLATSSFLKDELATAIADKQAVTRWLGTIGERPAVQRAMTMTLS
jgi:GSH-dependent disulfide-bond oxidoreductase